MLRFLRAVSGGRPFFPDLLFLQSPDCYRHFWMMAAICALKGLERPIRVLEVGSWVGGSTLTWAEAISRILPHKGSILCVDSWEPSFCETELNSDNPRLDHYQRMTSLAADDGAYHLFRYNTSFAGGMGVTVAHFRGRSEVVLPYLESGHFDLVYIDASHYYDDVRRDINEAKRLVRADGIICGDDLERQLHEIDARFYWDKRNTDLVSRSLNEGGFHPGITYSVGEAFGPVSCYEGFWIVRKSGGGFRNVTFSSIECFVPSHFPEAYKVPFLQYAHRVESASRQMAQGPS